MTHLRIEQNNNTEVVDANLIQKLYEIASSEDIQSIQLSGNLQCGYCYQTSYQYLTGNIEGTNQKRFPDLNIVAQGLYFAFQDAEVERILAQTFGDGNGILQSRVETLSSFSGKFSNNKNIEYFNELSSFPNITEINSNNRFNSCTNLKQIDLSNITKISGNNGYQRWNFESCTNLEYIGNTQNLTFLGHMAFNGCSKLKSINTSNVTVFKNQCLNGCTGLLDDIILSEGVTAIGDSAFNNVKKLPDTINLPNLQTLGNGFIKTNIKHVTNLGKITEIGGLFHNDNPFYNCTQLQDVIIPETVTLIKYGGLNGCNNIRWVKILSNTVPTYSSVTGFNSTENYGTFFAESWRNNDTTGGYTGKTYPIYVKDELLSQYQVADNWNHVGPGRLRALSQFDTDFPNG